MQERKKATRLKQTQAYTVDLAKIDGNGDFSCPRCGVFISPDDCTEEAYAILGTKINEQGLEELVIRCNKCASQLNLTGFSLLQKLTKTDEEKIKNQKKEENKKKSKPHYSRIEAKVR